MVASAQALTSVVVLADSLDFTPRVGDGPGVGSFEMLIGYAAWVGYRLAALGFVVSVGMAWFGRSQRHPGAEQWGKWGALTALAVVAGLAAAESLFAFARAVGAAA